MRRDAKERGISIALREGEKNIALLKGDAANGRSKQQQSKSRSATGGRGGSFEVWLLKFANRESG